MVLSPPPFEPDRFRSAAAHYESGRAPYAPALIRRVAEVVGLDRRCRALDLGCGTGALARGFAPFVGEALAIDPSTEMLEAARALAGEAANIRFVAGSSYDLGSQLGQFRLVTMGRSFHWMDRAETLQRLDQLIEPAGAVALFDDRAPAVPANAWRQAWREIRDRYDADADSHRRDPSWIRHEAVLLESPFSRLERFGIVERRALDVETLVRRTLSMSSTSPSRLGDEKTAEMVAELRAALKDVREEIVETSALVARRP
jgi:SAM-dependent methyltransferase